MSAMTRQEEKQYLTMLPGEWVQQMDPDPEGADDLGETGRWSRTYLTEPVEIRAQWDDEDGDSGRITISARGQTLEQYWATEDDPREMYDDVALALLLTLHWSGVAVPWKQPEASA